MPRYTRNAGKIWTHAEEIKLVELANGNTPTRVIGLELGRPVGGVYAKAQELKVSLMPINRSPYSRRK
jgi:hypothetical protein